MFTSEQFVSSVHMPKPDRRIAKTKKAIYQAFLQLLNDKGYDAITVQDIIDQADVGRSTFYSHYESKEFLLDELCRYLFHHLFEREKHVSIEDYLAHIFLHFRNNQDHVTSLLLSHNDHFIKQLRKELEHDVFPMLKEKLVQEKPTIPISYLKYFVISNFIETLRWWLSKGRKFSEKEVASFYLQMVAKIKQKTHTF